MAKIELAHLLDIEDLKHYKLHLAVKNDKNIEPLDSFIKGRRNAGEVGADWWWWQAAFREKNRWTRKYIFSLMRVHPEGDDVWLFGGIFIVMGKNEDSYNVHLTEKGREYIGRLKIIYHNTDQNVYRNLETDYSDLNSSEVEILKEPYWCSTTKS